MSNLDLRHVIEDIKSSISSEAIKNKIETDLGLIESSKKYVCFLHNDDSKNPNMSFNSDKKDFHCFRCNGHYDIFDHYMQHYGLGFVESAKKIVDDFNLCIDICIETHKKPKEPVLKHDIPTNKVLDYLRLRGISDTTVKYVGLAMDKDNVVFEYYNQYEVLEANKYRPAKKYKKDESKQFWWKGSTDALYNMQNVDITKPLVICEGEFDCIALIEAGFKNVVSPKAGAKSYEWIDKNWEWLKQFDEITIWYDNDNAGKEGAKTIASRLDNCTKVVYCNIANDINEVLVRFGKEEVLKQLHNAKELGVDGVITASQIENFNVYEAEKVKTGVRLLDANILGFVLGSLTIITGYNGSGKSTLINQMCIAESLKQGYKIFAFSGELTPSNFKFWLYSTLVDEGDLVEAKSFEGELYYKINPVAEQQLTEWIDDKLYLYDKIDYSQATILSIMEKLAKRKGVKVFIIDNLMKVELDPNERNELIAQKKFVNALKLFAIKYNAIVHLVAHPRKPQEGRKLDKFDVAGSADITNLADYVIGVHRASQEEKDKYEAENEKAQAQGKPVSIPNPKDASITLFKDRPTGSSEKEATLWFDRKRKRFYLNDYDLNKHYGYREKAIQSSLDEMYPF